MNMLMIEDDEQCAEILQRSLGKFCHILHRVDTLAQGLRCLTAELNVIWLDLVLLDSGSDQTIAAIPEMRAACPGATLIVVSGYGETMRARALAAGADAFATKDALQGFARTAIAALLLHAALHAMRRGARPDAILEDVSKFFLTAAGSAR